MAEAEKDSDMKKFLASHECNIEDRVYGHVDGIDLVATLYTPLKKEVSRSKAIVFVHGGGFYAGDRLKFSCHSAYFASKGLACMAISYRLVPHAIFPSQVQDANCAVRWLRKNAEEFNVDPNELYICGSSAGSHIAGLVAYANSLAEFNIGGGNEGFSSTVKGTVLFCGFFETLANEKILLQKKQNRINYLGGTSEQVPEMYQKASVVSHVSQDSPRTLLFHGDADTMVPISHSLCLQEALNRNKIENKLVVQAEGDHGAFSFGCPAFKSALIEMERFVFD